MPIRRNNHYYAREIIQFSASQPVQQSVDIHVYLFADGKFNWKIDAMCIHLKALMLLLGKEWCNKIYINSDNVFINIRFAQLGAIRLITQLLFT